MLKTRRRSMETKPSTAIQLIDRIFMKDTQNKISKMSQGHQNKISVHSFRLKSGEKWKFWKPAKLFQCLKAN